jgi:hypothetical protein
MSCPVCFKRGPLCLCGLEPIDLAVTFVRARESGIDSFAVQARVALEAAITEAGPIRGHHVQWPGGGNEWCLDADLPRALAHAVDLWIRSGKRKIARQRTKPKPARKTGPKPAERVEVLVSMTRDAAERLREGPRVTMVRLVGQGPG